MTDGPKLVSIPVKVAPMLRYRLQVAAEKAGLSQAEIVRRALDAYLRGSES